MALAVAKWRGRCTSPRRRHGLWTIGFGSRLAWDGEQVIRANPGRWKRMKRTSAGRSATCTRTNGPRRIPARVAKTKRRWMGILERGPKTIGSKVRVKVIDNAKKKTLQSEIRDHVLAGSAVFTDALKSYEGLDEFQHEVVDHAVEYVRGEVHTNGLENFWSLLKRGIHGTYVSVEPFHLFRYLDEQAFRYNNRKGLNDGERFDLAVRRIFGKRLTWNVLTGKVDGQEDRV